MKNISYIAEETYELIPGDLWASLIKHEPPGISEDGGASNVKADNQVSEEQPFPNERFPAISGRDSHDLVVRRVETQCCGGQTVRDQINPE